jgi:predicted RNA-binding Zn-ribbon protein involved in translation (DUF1610 family)
MMLGPEDFGIVARTSKEEFECHIDHLELHACPECDGWIASCRAHDDGLYCPDCGVTF